MHEVLLCSPSKMEGIVTRDWTESSDVPAVETEEPHEATTVNNPNPSSGTPATDTVGTTGSCVNSVKMPARPRRSSAQAARNKIQAVLAWEGCSESSAMFQTVAQKIEQELEHESKRRRADDEEDMYDGASDCHDVDETDSLVACSEADSYGRDSFVVSDDEGESGEEAESEEEEYFSATSDVEDSSNGDSEESNPQ